MRRWRHRVWTWSAGLFATVVLLSATLIGLFRVFAPLVPGYRAELEVWASAALNRPVQIGVMGAQWGLYGPELTLGQVALLSQDRRRVLLTAQEIRIGFTPGALLHRQFSRPNRIILIGPRMVLQRDREGRLEVRGLEGGLSVGSQPTAWRQAAGEVFAQDLELIISGGVATLFDRRPSEAPLVFEDIALKIDNGAGHHSLSGSLRLPRALGRTLVFAGHIRGTGLNPADWDWQAHLHGTGLDVPRILAFWKACPARFSRGSLDLRASASGADGRVLQARATFSVAQLTSAGGSSAAGTLNAVAGHLSFVQSPAGWILRGRRVQVTRGQERWPASDFTLQYAHPSADGFDWSGTASFLRLHDIVTLVASLPKKFSTETARVLQLSPRGTVSTLGFNARWNGKSLAAWSVHAAFSGLGLNADGRIPGFTGLEGAASLDQAGGTLKLLGKNASATFPQLFRGPLIATVSAEVQLRHDTAGWRFSSDDVSIANADAEVRAQGNLLLPGNGRSPSIDLKASVRDAAVRKKSTYLPVGIMPKPVVDWVDHAVVSGKIESGRVVLQGPLADFPFRDGRGLFDVRFHLLHGVLDYAPGWPKLEDLDADVDFKDAGMVATVAHGRFLADHIGGTQARFADLRTGILTIQGTARGSAETALDFLRQSPIRGHFGADLDGLKASGRSEVRLNLVLPVGHLAQYQWHGKVRLREVSLGGVQGWPWPLSHVNGTVAMGGEGLSTEDLRGTLLGEPVAINLRPEAGATHLRVEGGVSAKALTAALPAPWSTVLAGSSRWQLVGQVPNTATGGAAGLSLTLTSDLHGLSVALPAPFGKLASLRVPLHARLSLPSATRMRFKMHYGDRISGRYRVVDAGGRWHLDRGDLNFGPLPPASVNTAGLVVTGTLPVFSLDAWKPYFPNSGPRGVPAFLQGIDLQIFRLSGFGYEIPMLRVQLARGAHAWKLALGGPAIAGQIALPYQMDAQHPIVADLRQVVLVHRAAPLEKNTPTPFRPTDVPPLRIRITQFRYNDIALDNVHADLVPQPDGVALKSFSVDSPSFKLTSSGAWITAPAGEQHSTLSVQMQSRNVEKTLQAFGYAPGVTGDKAVLQANLHWRSGPLDDIVSVLNGTLHIKLEHGHLVEVRPGAGRIFGLLSINALPRHLLLNFSDVLGKGLAYDSIEADFTLQDGDAYTSDLTVAGPAARIHMVGRIGLAKHDFDEALLVEPSVGGSLPLVGALAAGVSVGVVVYLLTRILRTPLSKVGEMRYRLTGTWDNPVLTKVPASQTSGHDQH